MKPRSTPKLSTRTLAIGARQLVVQLALLITSCLALSYMSSLTPRQMVTSGPLAGALMIDLLGAGLEVLGGGGALGEAPGGLDHDVGAELAPGELGGVGLGGHAQALAVDHEGILFDLDAARVDAVHGVVTEQVAQGLGVGEVVDRHELDVGSLL